MPETSPSGETIPIGSAGLVHLPTKCKFTIKNQPFMWVNVSYMHALGNMSHGLKNREVNKTIQYSQRHRCLYSAKILRYIFQDFFLIPRDPGSPKVNGFMEALKKSFVSFRFGD